MSEKFIPEIHAYITPHPEFKTSTTTKPIKFSQTSSHQKDSRSGTIPAVSSSLSVATTGLSCSTPPKVL